MKLTPELAQSLDPEEAAALYLSVQESRKEADKVAKELKKDEMLIKERIMIILDEKDGIVYGDHAFTRTEKIVASITDWHKLQEFIAETGNFQILQRRIKDAAIKELASDGVKVPGTEPLTTFDLSIRKIGGK